MAASNRDDFDGYRKWLGITTKNRIPTHYELLAIPLDEEDPDVIQAAAEQRRRYVESKRGDGHDDLVTEIVYRINEAESTLLNVALRRDYDRKLNLFEKRQKSRQYDPNAPRSRFKSRPGKTVGEDGGIVPTFVKIMAVVCIGFGLMAWFSFGLPWSRPVKPVELAQGQPPQPPVVQRPIVQPEGQPPVVQPQQPPADAIPEQQKPIKTLREVPQAIPTAPIGTWIEKRSDAPGGDRVRTFEDDGTFVIVSPKMKQRLVGTWRRDGSRVYFSHPAASPEEQPTVDKWFEIARSDDQQMTIRMMGQREYVWQKKEPQEDASVAEPPNEDVTAKVTKALQGDWKCTYCEQMGEKPDTKQELKAADRRVTVEGNNYSMQRTQGGKRSGYKGKFEIIPDKGHFDWIGEGPGGGLTKWIGIYELDGDTLKVCYRYNQDGNAERPTKFKTDSSKKNPSAFYTFKRESD